MKNTKKIDRVVLEIAKEHLSLETLETQKMDGLDFKEQAVWQIKKALEAAYLAGKNSCNF